MKKNIVMLMLLLSSLGATELTPQIESDIASIVQNRFNILYQNREEFGKIIKAVRGEISDVDKVYEQVFEYVSDPKQMALYYPHFLKNFTAEEISFLRQVYEDSTVLKLEGDNGIKSQFTQIFLQVLTNVIPEKIVSDLFELTQENYVESTKNGLVIVDVYASWCGPCKKMAPVFEDLSKEFSLVTFAKVDADKQQALLSNLQVKGIPTFIFYNKGKEVARIVGFIEKEAFKEKIKEVFSL